MRLADITKRKFKFYHASEYLAQERTVPWWFDLKAQYQQASAARRRWQHSPRDDNSYQSGYEQRHEDGDRGPSKT